MIAKLVDPWFEARFYGDISLDESYRFLDSIDGAQGLWLWCPCGYGRPEYPLEGARPHAILVPFANPRSAPRCPPRHGPYSRRADAHPRWTMQGTSLADLTTTPSVDVGGGGEGRSCWHGFITNGEVR